MNLFANRRLRQSQLPGGGHQAPQTRRLAEAEMQAALKLDPENFGYRLMLAELYFDLGFLRRAEGELKRALKAEPNNPAGLRLLRRIEAAAT